MIHARGLMSQQQIDAYSGVLISDGWWTGKK